MKRQRWLAVAVVVGVLGLASAQEKGTWQPLSTTARGITGPVSFGGEKIAINFSGFALAQIRTLDAAEIHAVFSPESQASGSGNLFRTSIPAGKRFLNKNTLCGSEETQWVVTFVSGKDLELAFFSGAKMPVFTAEAIGSSTNLCGTFSFVR